MAVAPETLVFATGVVTVTIVLVEPVVLVPVLLELVMDDTTLETLDVVTLPVAEELPVDPEGVLRGPELAELTKELVEPPTRLLVDVSVETVVEPLVVPLVDPAGEVEFEDRLLGQTDSMRY